MRICGGRLAGLACALLALCADRRRSRAGRGARRAAALGPEVAIGEPSGGYVGRLSVAPEHGPAGTPLTVTAEGLPAGAGIPARLAHRQRRWKVADAEYHGREYRPVAYEIAKVKTDAAGRLTATFVAPEDFGFVHDIVLQQGDRLFTQVGFSIDMTVEISPKSGPVGTPITVEVKGIGWRSLFNSWDLLYDNNFTGWMSSVTTARLRELHDSGDRRARRAHPGGAARRADLPLPQHAAEPGAGPAALGDPVHGHGGRAGAAAAARAAGADTMCAGCRRAGELVATPPFSGVGRAGGGARRRLRAGQDLSAQLDPRGRQPDDRRGLGGIVHGRSPRAKADGAGRVEFRFKVPDDLGGAHGLWVDTGGGEKDRRRTGSQPTALPLDVGRGPVGTTFTIHLKGVGWTETANIYHLVYDNNYIGYACAFNSQGDVEIIIKATGAPGWHFIDLYPGIYKGAETRPNNFRIPQLTYAQDHPGEDLPAFHFAFEVTGEVAAGLDR